MKRIIDAKIDPAHYEASAYVIWCFDARFSDDRPGKNNLFEKFKEKLGLRNVDLVEVAGGIKDIASSESESDRDYLLGQIEKSVKLHKPPVVMLMAHLDCGAYGGRKDEDFYIEELNKAGKVVADFLASRGIKMDIRKFLADFEGLLEV